MRTQTTIPLSDPDAILAAWRTLAASAEHLHQPQVSARLGVPEASLVAARCGDGATRLSGPVREILVDAAGLGKLLIAVPHHAGVALAIAKDLHCQCKGDWLELSAAEVGFRVRMAAVDSLYTLIDPMGPHGRERHLQLYDAEGNGICKLLVLYKRHEAGLRALAERWRARDQQRIWRPTGASHGREKPRPRFHGPLSTPAPRPDAALERWQGQRVPIHFRFRRPDLALDVTCRPKRLRTDDRHVLHVQHPAFKMHLRLAAWGESGAWGDGVCSGTDSSWVGFRPVRADMGEA
ncbi:MAG: hypothetical protein JJT90_03320 [Ectothiorhodospiraceae bacterium]|nr:hypothetical protein [Ectothiorhodospiraceae bacterium]